MDEPRAIPQSIDSAEPCEVVEVLWTRDGWVPRRCEDVAVARYEGKRWCEWHLDGAGWHPVTA